MPLYDFNCRCGAKHEDVFLSVKQITGHREMCECGSQMLQSFRSSTVRKPFKPYVDEHIAEEPVLIESSSHRDRLMKEEGLVHRGRKIGMPGCQI